MTAINITYSQDFSQFAAQLRELGAKFYVQALGKNRIIEFSQLTENASNLIEYYRKPKEDTTIDKVSKPEAEVTQIVEYLTEVELNKFTKKELENLAKDQGLTIPKSEKTKGKLINFLVGKLQK